MTDFTYAMGKGLKEPCSPYRSDYVFGAELNDFDANNWNCPPAIWDPTTSFDLSPISYGHEVVVALLRARLASAGTYEGTFKWYRDRDNALLYEYYFGRVVGAGDWFYFYSYIGWVDWEINENGGYHVDIAVSGPDSFSQTIPFTVTGIPVEEPTPPVAVGFMAPITEMLSSVASFFYTAWQEVDGWIWPFNLLSSPLYGVYSSFYWIAYYFNEFSAWVSDITAKAAEILSGIDILSMLSTWLNYAATAWYWVTNAFSNVWDIVGDWWSGVKYEVLGWIDDAKLWFQALLNEANTWLATLQSYWDSIVGKIPTWDAVVAWWSNWPGNVMAVITGWWGGALLDVVALIDSSLLEWFPFYDDVAEFFKDPGEFLLSRLTDWFLGPEE